MSDNSSEIAFNLWFIIDEALGVVYALMGRAYALNGNDDEKLRILHSLASTDYLLAKRYRVPENFSVMDPAGNKRERLIDPQFVMNQANLPLVFEDVFRELEKGFPPKMTWVNGEMISEVMVASKSPLMVCTGLMEYQDGHIQPLVKPYLYEAADDIGDNSDDSDEDYDIGDNSDDSDEDYDDYILDPHDTFIISKGIVLLQKLLTSNVGTPAQKITIEKIFQVLNRLPKTSQPFDLISVTLTSPTRSFGQKDPHQIYHRWTIEIEHQYINISSGGHFYRKSTGGDSFTTMMWSASPGNSTDFSDFLFDHQIVDDAKPFEQEIEEIDLSIDGYTLYIEDEENELLAECDDETDEVHPEESKSSTSGGSGTEAEKRLSVLADVVVGQERDEWFANPPDVCDYCKCSFIERSYFVDAKERGSQMWGFMCAECFFVYGEAVRYGRGQIYQKRGSGKWLCVAGFAPESDPDE
jgi:hypothetical protein